MSPEPGRASVRVYLVSADGDAPDSAAAVPAVVSAAPSARVVALAMPGVESRLVALAEVGIAGYVSRDGSPASTC